MTSIGPGWAGRLEGPHRAFEAGAEGDGTVGEPAHLSLIQRWPIYPVLVVTAAVLAIFVDAAATVEHLPRPIISFVIAAIIVQLALSGIFRSRHVGAYAATCVGLGLLNWPIVAIVLASIPASAALAALVLRRSHSRVPWPRVTEFLNIAGAGILVITFSTTWNSGALTPIARPHLNTAPGSGPDIYVILLDGYPRADTLREDFGYDNNPFLSKMKGLGFELAENAHSNYNLTALTLASMFNMAQVPDIDGLDAEERPVQQYRSLARATSTGAALQDFRDRGYEIVTVSSPAGITTLWSADRVYDGSSINELEFWMLQLGANPLIFPDAQRTLVMDSLRSRIVSGFDQTVQLARERAERPKLVFTHIMSPHVPILFGPDGSPREGWPCYPQCAVFDAGWRYGDGVLEPFRGQLEHVNTLVASTVEEILEVSPEPPAIVIFSDHGSRHDMDDREEQLRSLLLAHTPGQRDVFPDDATPVNLFPHLLNAYFDAGLPLDSEEAYTADLAALGTTGPLALSPMTSKAP